MRFLKFVGKLGFVFIVGGLGGVVGNQVVVPRLSAYPSVAKFLHITPGVTVVNPKEEIIIDRTDALRLAVERVRPTVVSVERYSKNIPALASADSFATGVILTEDGVIATDAASVSGPGKLFIVRAGEFLPAKLLKVDAAHGIALVKTEARGLPVPNFGDTNALAGGDTVFGMRAFRDQNDKQFLSETMLGYVAYTRADAVAYSFSLSEATRGMPVFNTKGELVAMSHTSVEAGGNDTTASILAIKDLLLP